MVTIALCPLPSPHILCQLTSLPTLTDGSSTLPEIAWSRNSSLQPDSYRAAHQWILFVIPHHTGRKPLSHLWQSTISALGKSLAYLSKPHQHSSCGHTLTKSPISVGFGDLLLNGLPHLQAILKSGFLVTHLKHTFLAALPRIPFF